MNTEKLSSENETSNGILGAVISRFFRWFKISCPKCKIGKLNQDDIHHCRGGGKLNVYTCDKCKSQFV